MQNSILQEALREERQLIARLDAVRAVIRAYGGEPSVLPVSQNDAAHPRAAITRSPSEATKKIKALLIDLLHGSTDPTPTRDLVSLLQSEGVGIAGKNPVATLSALLSHADEFEPVGRKGWLLKSRTLDVATSSAASNGGDSPPLIESQKEVTPAD